MDILDAASVRAFHDNGSSKDIIIPNKMSPFLLFWFEIHSVDSTPCLGQAQVGEIR